MDFDDIPEAASEEVIGIEGQLGSVGLDALPEPEVEDGLT
jgi:hypothetical protein